MMKSSRHLVRAACAAALLAGIGAGIAAAQPVIVEKAMPAPIIEVVPAAPGAGYNWVPGHWAWRGGAWFWVKGHHIRGVVAVMPAPVVEVIPARPSPAHVWIKGHHSSRAGAGSGIPASGSVADEAAASPADRVDGGRRDKIVPSGPPLKHLTVRPA